MVDELADFRKKFARGSAVPDFRRQLQFMKKRVVEGARLVSLSLMFDNLADHVSVTVPHQKTGTRGVTRANHVDEFTARESFACGRMEGWETWEKIGALGTKPILRCVALTGPEILTPCRGLRSENRDRM